ncbi:MAG: glycine cleavage T C-terminal barrel domain-containing protein [Planctomycetaceae bacterium]
MDPAWRELQLASGAVFEDPAVVVSLAGFAGAPDALHYGDPRGEYFAARDGAAIFDLHDRTQIEITGRDRVAFLNNFCTNDVKKLEPWQGCEAFLTNVKGRILAHVFVFVDSDSIWLETVAGAAPAIIAHLDKYVITEDVQLPDRTEEWGELFACGPGSIDRSLRKFVSFSQRIASSGLGRTRRVDLFGVPGVLTSLNTGEAGVLLRETWEVWTRPGGKERRPAGAAAFHALRIEARLPLVGVDIGEENLAQEAARTEQAISFTKGCYLGQEPIARLDALGHTNRELRTLRLEAGPVPAAGTPVFGNDQEIGRITSAALSYADDKPVALAVIRRPFIAPGSQVTVGEPRTPAKVE